jgi:hypothetical protein
MLCGLCVLEKGGVRWVDVLRCRGDERLWGDKNKLDRIEREPRGISREETSSVGWLAGWLSFRLPGRESGRE